MDKAQIAETAAKMVEAVRASVAAATAPLAARIVELEAALKVRPEKGAKGDPGRDGKDGEKGAPGTDVFSLEDFAMALAEDGRTLTIKFERGEKKIERSITLETLRYREVWREGEYKRGDVVSWAGSAWHCQQQTTDKPGQSPAWRLMVKEGRAVKDATAHAPAAHKPVRVA